MLQWHGPDSPGLFWCHLRNGLRPPRSCSGGHYNGPSKASHGCLCLQRGRVATIKILAGRRRHTAAIILAVNKYRSCKYTERFIPKSWNFFWFYHIISVRDAATIDAIWSSIALAILLCFITLYRCKDILTIKSAVQVFLHLGSQAHPTRKAFSGSTLGALHSNITCCFVGYRRMVRPGTDLVQEIRVKLVLIQCFHMLCGYTGI